MRLDGKLHRQLAQHLLSITIDNQTHGIFGRQTSLIAVEELLLGDLRGRSLVLDYGRRILYVHIWECVCATLVANEQRVALRIVASVLGTLSHTHQTAIAVLAATCRDTLRHDARTGVATDVNHLCTRICLLEVVGHRHRVELRHAVVAREDTTRIFPRDCRAGFDLRPRQACVVALADTALGHEVVDAALALLVARVPILYGRIFHLGIFQYDDLDYGGV